MDDATVTGSADLSCDEAVELMTAYLEGALTDGARERFEHHLALCTGCDNHLDQLRHTVATTGRLARQDLRRRCATACWRRSAAGRSARDRVQVPAVGRRRAVQRLPLAGARAGGTVALGRVGAQPLRQRHPRLHARAAAVLAELGALAGRARRRDRAGRDEARRRARSAAGRVDAWGAELQDAFCRACSERVLARRGRGDDLDGYRRDARTFLDAGEPPAMMALLAARAAEAEAGPEARRMERRWQAQWLAERLPGLAG